MKTMEKCVLAVVLICCVLQTGKLRWKCKQTSINFLMMSHSPSLWHQMLGLSLRQRSQVR